MKAKAGNAPPPPSLQPISHIELDDPKIDSAAGKRLLKKWMFDPLVKYRKGLFNLSADPNWEEWASSPNGMPRIHEIVVPPLLTEVENTFLYFAPTKMLRADEPAIHMDAFFDHGRDVAIHMDAFFDHGKDVAFSPAPSPFTPICGNGEGAKMRVLELRIDSQHDKAAEAHNMRAITESGGGPAVHERIVVAVNGNGGNECFCNGMIPAHKLGNGASGCSGPHARPELVPLYTKKESKKVRLEAQKHFDGVANGDVFRRSPSLFLDVGAAGGGTGNAGGVGKSRDGRGVSSWSGASSSSEFGDGSTNKKNVKIRKTAFSSSSFSSHSKSGSKNKKDAKDSLDEFLPSANELRDVFRFSAREEMRHKLEETARLNNEADVGARIIKTGQRVMEEERRHDRNNGVKDSFLDLGSLGFGLGGGGAAAGTGAGEKGGKLESAGDHGGSEEYFFPTHSDDIFDFGRGEAKRMQRELEARTGDGGGDKRVKDSFLDLGSLPFGLGGGTAKEKIEITGDHSGNGEYFFPTHSDDIFDFGRGEAKRMQKELESRTGNRDGEGESSWHSGKDSFLDMTDDLRRPRNQVGGSTSSNSSSSSSFSISSIFTDVFSGLQTVFNMPSYAYGNNGLGFTRATSSTRHHSTHSTAFQAAAGDPTAPDPGPPPGNPPPINPDSAQQPPPDPSVDPEGALKAATTVDPAISLSKDGGPVNVDNEGNSLEPKDPMSVTKEEFDPAPMAGEVVKKKPDLGVSPEQADAAGETPGWGTLVGPVNWQTGYFHRAKNEQAIGESNKDEFSDGTMPKLDDEGNVIVREGAGMDEHGQIFTPEMIQGAREHKWIAPAPPGEEEGGDGGEGDGEDPVLADAIAADQADAADDEAVAAAQAEDGNGPAVEPSVGDPTDRAEGMD